MPQDFSGRRAFLSSLSAALMSSVLATRGDAETAPLPEILAEMSSLASLNDAQVAHTADRMYTWRKTLFDLLSKQLTDPAAKTDTKIYAIYFLGAFRLTEAAALLVDHIMLKDTSERQDTYATWYWSTYPAQTALSFLGSACLPALIEGLATTDDPISRLLLLTVFNEILAIPACVKVYLNNGISLEPDAMRKARLQVALMDYRKHYEHQ